MVILREIEGHIPNIDNRSKSRQDLIRLTSRYWDMLHQVPPYETPNYVIFNRSVGMIVIIGYTCSISNRIKEHNMKTQQKSICIGISRCVNVFSHSAMIRDEKPIIDDLPKPVLDSQTPR